MRDADQRKNSVKPYWNTKEDLDQYDAFFGERIAWKWDTVFENIPEFLGSFEGKTRIRVLDYGCGSGIAIRSFLKHLSYHNQNLKIDVFLYDHSSLSIKYTEEKVRNLKTDQVLGVEGVSGIKGDVSYDLILISHVLNEIDHKNSQLLSKIFSVCAKSILVVEAGDPASSKNLVEFRDRMLGLDFRVMKPCPHQVACPLKSINHKNDWCHFLAKPPSYASQNADWREFSKQMSIDIRRQALSFMWLQKNSNTTGEDLSVHRFATIIGDSFKSKAGLNIQACSKEQKVEAKVLRKDFDRRISKEISQHQKWFLDL